MGMNEPTVRELRELLLSWFEEHARVLPWRTEHRDPYAVWVSETMLQQTRVTTVIPYFHRFMERFPTVRDLASAPLDDVLAMWSGLGYYRRARALHAASCEVVRGGGVTLPGCSSALQMLPGIGPYTAAAIASIAYGECVPVVDGNVIRVLARMTNDDDPMDTSSAVARVRSLAGRLVDPVRPGMFNEAMMELGALVCMPTAPSCDACPWCGHCGGRRAGRVDALPVVREKAESPRVALDAFVLFDGWRVLMCRRRPDGLFGGLWEPPMGEARRGSCVRQLVERMVGGKGERLRGRIVHVLTHRVLDVRVTRWVVEEGSVCEDGFVWGAYEEARWVGRDEVSLLGMSSLASKVLVKAGWGKG